jgi:hypothetical protein
MSRLLDPQNFVAEKLAWQLQVLTNTSLTPLAKTLAALLMHVLNSKMGDGYRSQAWLAEALGVTGRSIRRVCDDLEEAGRLRVTVYGVRGKANSYRALLKSEPVAPVVEDPAFAGHDRMQRRTSVSSLESQRRTAVAHKEDARVRPSLSKSNTTPLPPTGAGAPRRAFPRDDIRRAATQARGTGWLASMPASDTLSAAEPSGHRAVRCGRPGGAGRGRRGWRRPGRWRPRSRRRRPRA